jgi:hypothetical protein
MPNVSDIATALHSARSATFHWTILQGRRCVTCWSILYMLAIMMAANIDPVLSSEPVAVSAAWQGSAEPMFDGDMSGCDKMDYPDESARAFRDAGGRVHLFATHDNARAMVGPTLDTMKHDCRVVYRSRQDSDPAHFEDRNWLAAFFTEDGRRIVALLHSEYEAWNHRGMCAALDVRQPAVMNCWWNTVTMAVSRDGGMNFTPPRPPDNLVASLPYPYSRANTAGPLGYRSPTNIIKVGGYYYVMINDWPYKAQRGGPCLVRTSDLYNAASWRAWDGSDFTIRFVDPYVNRGFKPEEHVCVPVGGGAIRDPGSLSVYRDSGINIIVEFVGKGPLGPPGLYISASSDLIHWSTPSLIASTEAMLREEPAGMWDYAYFALIDPSAPDRNFATIYDRPFVYYVRFNLSIGKSSRILMRRRIQLHIPSQAGR